MRRTYETTHPWLTFLLDLQRCPPTMWMALGEAQSKCEHLAGVPLKPKIAEDLHRLFLAKGVHATTAIEGNTLTEDQVLRRIQDGHVDIVPKSQHYLQTEIDNVISLSNTIANGVADRGFVAITVKDIQDYNNILLMNLDHEEHVVPGQVRHTSVGVSDYRGPDHRDCEHLLGLLCEWLNSNTFEPPSGGSLIAYGIIKAIIAHLYLAWIHAFSDGNGRTARAIEVRFLMESTVPKSAAHLLSNHYNQTRAEYYRQLSRASKAGGDVTAFLKYSIDGLVDQLRAQLDIVRNYQWDVAWENYIYERFGQDKTLADKRQIKLLLALSPKEDGVERSTLGRLTPDLAYEYAQKTTKTLSRDLNRLEHEGFIVRVGSRVRANKQLILAFLPRRNHTP